MKFRLATIVAIALARAAIAAAPGSDAPLEPRPGVLLLRNGELISGTISQSGDGYDVVLPDGEMRIRTSDVELFSSSPEECYERKREAIDADKIEEHLELAQWCLRNRLPKQAGQELSAAMEIEPGHPKIPVLERRIKLTVEETHEASKPAEQRQKLVLAEELDRMVRGMPAGSVETFTQVVQPLLINHCANAGCHGPQAGGSFRLLRVPNGKMASRRSTQRNLYAALAQINHQSLAASPLLTEPLRAHGSTKGAIFTDREASQYKQLVMWVSKVASAHTPENPQTVGDTPRPLLQSLSSGPTMGGAAFQVEHRPRRRTSRGTRNRHGAGSLQSNVQPLAQPQAQQPQPAELHEVASQPKDDTDIPDAEAAGAAETTGSDGTPAKVKRPAEPRGSFTPRDEFDPEIFNRGLE